MGKNVYGLKRPKREILVIPVTDESNPGEVFTFTLREPNLTSILRVDGLQKTYSDIYFKPNRDGELLPPPPVEGKSVEVTEEILQIACSIFSMQISIDDGNQEFYSVEEILVLMETMEAGMMVLLAKVGEAVDKFRGIIENPMIAVTTPLSDSTTGTLADTLN